MESCQTRGLGKVMSVISCLCKYIYIHISEYERETFFTIGNYPRVETTTTPTSLVFLLLDLYTPKLLH